MADNQQNLAEANRQIQECLDKRASELDLSHLQLTAIPKLLVQHSKQLNRYVTKLNLTNNQLTEIRLLAGLTNLIGLYLGNNQLVDIQPLAKLTNLTRLWLDKNKLTDIQPLAELSKLTELNLTNNQLTDIQPLAGLTNLIGLYLGNNQLTDIQPLAKLTNLTRLYLGNNQFTDIYPLARLINLTRLDLNNNQLTDIQPLAKLTNLTTLNLGFNELIDIQSLAGLTANLTKLYLFDNQLKSTKSLTKLTNLTELNLSNNKLIDIQPLTKLINLTKLFLNDNQFIDIESLENFLKNKNRGNFVIRMHNNPFWQGTNITPDDDIFANHYDDLMLYFKKLHAENKTFLFLPQKVVFLGNHESGKSSSLEFLHNHELTKKTKSTHILDIEYILPDNYQVEEKTEEMFQASCYDFGGQDFYHGIYRIFLQDASIALLLINPKRNHNHQALQNQDSRHDTLAEQYTQHFDVRYWRGLLNYMHSPYNRRPQSDDGMAVFLLQSHADKMPMMDWSLPALISAKISANQSQPIAEHSKTEQSQKEQGKQTTETVKQKSIQLAGFYHVDLATVNLQENRSTPQLDFFAQQFKQCIKDKQRLIEIPLAEVEFLKGLMERANEPKPKQKTDNEKNDTNTDTNDKDNSDNTKKYDCQPTRFSELKDKFEFLFDKSGTEQETNGFTYLKTQIQQYHKSGMVLYDESLSINQSETIKEHIVWLNPQGLIEFIHDELLSMDKIKQNKGIVPQKEFDSIVHQHLRFNTGDKTNDKLYQQSIVKLLENHQVIFEHQYKAGTKSAKDDNEYIIPNYLPLASHDPSYELICADMGKPAFCLAFTDFIPMGMINQFVNLFGRQPDKKLFWRDAMIFTLSHADSEDKFKIHLQLDMQRLTIKVHISAIASKGNSKIISYLYYCILNAYWSYLTQLTPLSYEEFIEQFIKIKLDELPQDIEEFNDYHAQQIAQVQQLFADNDDYIPDDMYISRDGENFVKYADLFTDEDLYVPCYQPNYQSSYLQEDKDNEQAIKQAIENEIENKTEQNQKDTASKPFNGFDNSERMIRQTNSIAMQDFQPFTSRPLRKIARIFISYSHLDMEYKDNLLVHLSMLEREKHHIFADTKINTGEFDKRIQEELEQADIVIFMMSANFFNSDYIFHRELSKVLTNNQSGKGKKQVIIPVLITDFDYHSLSSLITDDFTQENFDNFVNASDDERDSDMMKECGKYLFRPYYRDNAKGEGKLLPIELWASNERNSAYKQVVEVVREAIGGL